MRAIVFCALVALSLLPATARAAQSDSDKAAARQISTHIQQSGQLRNYRIGVTYQEGVATLQGTVANAQQRETAIRLAEQVSGVANVESQLQLADSNGPKAGSEIRNGSSHASANGAAPQRRPADVMQASGSTPVLEATPVQRNSMASRGNRQTSQQPRQMRRGNMPMPARRFAPDPAVRQASAQAHYAAGGPQHGGGYGGPPMGGQMGPAMGGPGGPGGPMGAPVTPAGFVPHAHARGPSYENAQMPGYAWPSYASYPNYAALSYPQQYSPTAWPYIGPFYPYPQVPLAWRKVSLEWDDGWWFLDFSAHNSSH